jgi:acyl-CoA synthetase (AMP-forming)/AMP-acid ligase II
MSAPAATVFRRVQEHADRDPGAVALEGDGRSWTYGQLCRDAAAVGGGLLSLGLRAGDRVAVLASNHPETALLWLAGSRTGIVPVLVNPGLTDAELGSALGRLRPALLFADADHAERLAGIAPGLPTTPSVLGLFDLDPGWPAGTLAQLRESAPATVADPDPASLFEITLTSGTTQLPKLVGLSHGGEVRHWTGVGRRLGLSPADCVLVASPLFHSSGIRNATCVMWCAGGRTVIAPRFSASGFLAQAVAAGATWSCMVETMLVLIARATPDDAALEQSRLRFVIGSGAPDLLARIERRFGLRVVHAYGSTESGMPVTTGCDQAAEANDELRRRRPGASPAGWPIDGCAIRLVRDGTDVPPGGDGEIWVRSSLAPVVYLDEEGGARPAEIDGWYRSGDLGGRGPDGALYFLDRINDVIRRGGENFASREVETVLGAHPAVRQAVVIPVPDPVYVQEAKAIILARSGHAVEAEELWEWCATRLARFKVPRYLEFRETVPTNASGRVQKSLLRNEKPPPASIIFDRTTDSDSAQGVM